MKTINEVRKAIKPLGFSVKTKSLSWGQHATYFRINDKKELPTIFTSETIKEWQQLIDWRKENNESLKAINCKGLII